MQTLALILLTVALVIVATDVAIFVTAARHGRRDLLAISTAVAVIALGAAWLMVR